MHDALAELGGGGDRQVDGDRRPADAALGLKTATTRPGSRARRWPRVAAAGGPAATGATAIAALLLALAGVDLADRGGQLVAAERLDQELAGAGEHRAAQVVGLALDGHHHDRGVGRRSADSCSVAAMPSMPGMLMSIRTTSGLSRRPSRGPRARTRPTPTTSMSLSKPSSFVEVVARLGDVVDDEDTDLVGHLALVGPCGAMRWRMAGTVDGRRTGAVRSRPSRRGCGPSDGRVGSVRLLHRRTVSTSSGGGRRSVSTRVLRMMPVVSAGIGGSALAGDRVDEVVERAQDQRDVAVHLGELDDFGLLGVDRQDHDLLLAR